MSELNKLNIIDKLDKIENKISVLRQELKSDILNLRGELKSDILNLRGELKSDIKNQANTRKKSIENLKKFINKKYIKLSNIPHNIVKQQKKIMND